MNKELLKKLLPHVVAVVLFFLIALIYSKPLLEGKRLETHDMSVYMAIAKANTDYEKANDRLVFWNNSMFSGMPTYAVSVAKQENIFNKIYLIFILGGLAPLNLIFWYLLGFYILLNAFKVNPWLSMFGSLAFAFSSYYFVIITAGHFTKAIAIGFMAPVIGGIYMAFEQKRPWAGMFLMTFFMALQILSNHVQITYYTGLMILIYGIFELVSAIREKYLLRFTKTVGILSIGVLLSVGINAAFIMTTQEYIPYSIRGQSELSSADGNRTSGLDKSYATQYSYGIDETFTLLIPNVKGGASVSELSENSATYQVVSDIFGKASAKEIVKTMPTYFGDLVQTSGPFYVGAFVVFLFVLGLFVVKGKVKWWLLTVTIVSIVLSWGKNLEFVTHFFLDYFPGYNKFRTVSMILVLAETAMPLLGVLALVEIFKSKIEIKKLMNYFYIALGVTGLLTMIFIVYPSIFGLSGEGKNEIQMAEYFSSAFPNDPQYDQAKTEFKNNFVNAIYEDRASMVRNDAFRSLAFIILGAAVVYFLIRKKIKPNIAIAMMAVVVLADMWTVNRRYLNDDNFVSKRKYEVPFEQTNADKYILADTEKHYRVSDIDPRAVFNDGSISFYHKSIGGYSGAKMRRYQELADSMMYQELYMAQYIVQYGFQNGMADTAVQALFDAEAKTPVLDMLNTKYLIFDPNYAPIINEDALGNAWFVEDYKFVENADEEIKAMKTLNPAVEAVIDRKFQDKLSGYKPSFDSLATIKLVDVAPDFVVYESEASAEQLAVFSEIYYPNGWVVTVDGKETDHFRANYVLRAMRVPAGKHTIKFEFVPVLYKKGVAISYACSIALFLMIGAGVFFEYKKKKKGQELKK
ncbi:MAG TPA: YfhO family protein [Bacteroidales bacterium]|nr:YfhO family protein [Bacteroidales bacterium]